MKLNDSISTLQHKSHFTLNNLSLNFTGGLSWRRTPKGLELFQSDCKWCQLNVRQRLAEGFLETADEKKTDCQRGELFLVAASSFLPALSI